MTDPCPAGAEQPEVPAPAPAPVPVLHLDEHLVAISKPSGMLVHRDERHADAPAALQTVRDQVGRFLYPVHRLDRGTSGILLFAFSSETAALLQRCMQAPDANKEYLALVRFPGSGGDLGAQWCSERPLTDEKGIARPARTEFELVEPFHRCGVVRARIATGRYHQIRRHLAHCGRHVIGDTTHGKGRINQWFRDRHGLWRLFLHHHRLVTRHPRSDAMLELHDPLPPELQTVLARLRGGPGDAPAQTGATAS